MMSGDIPPRYGAIAIGRNEGERLKRCLLSLSGATRVIYVDSGSTDGSVGWAKELGVEVVELDTNSGFTAARARNAGFDHLQKIARGIEYVQFVDGDCELDRDWPSHAISFLEAHERVCAVFGRRRERFPDRSIYNYLCDLEWDVPVGEAHSCGGDVMMRSIALANVGGYRNDMIAGEEPELCLRLRAAGWTIRRLDYEMSLHDAAMLDLSQWWRRQLRSGYAFAQGAYLHGKTPVKHRVWESCRAVLWGIGLPVLLANAAILFGWWSCFLLLVYPLQVVRRMITMPGTWSVRAQFAFFEQLSRFPEVIGLLRFVRDRLRGRHGQLIEYK
jgi:glycosyltransferase involved in cell wall biosynthesis